MPVLTQDLSTLLQTLLQQYLQKLNWQPDIITLLGEKTEALVASLRRQFPHLDCFQVSDINKFRALLETYHDEEKLHIVTLQLPLQLNFKEMVSVLKTELGHKSLTLLVAMDHHALLKCEQYAFKQHQPFNMQSWLNDHVVMDELIQSHLFFKEYQHAFYFPDTKNDVGIFYLFFIATEAFSENVLEFLKNLTETFHLTPTRVPVLKEVELAEPAETDEEVEAKEEGETAEVEAESEASESEESEQDEKEDSESEAEEESAEQENENTEHEEIEAEKTESENETEAESEQDAESEDDVEDKEDEDEDEDEEREPDDDELEHESAELAENTQEKQEQASEVESEKEEHHGEKELESKEHEYEETALFTEDELNELINELSEQHELLDQAHESLQQHVNEIENLLKDYSEPSLTVTGQALLLKALKEKQQGFQRLLAHYQTLHQRHLSSTEQFIQSEQQVLSEQKDNYHELLQHHQQASDTHANHLELQQQFSEEIKELIP